MVPPGAKGPSVEPQRKTILVQVNGEIPFQVKSSRHSVAGIDADIACTSQV